MTFAEQYNTSAFAQNDNYWNVSLQQNTHPHNNCLLVSEQNKPRL